MKKMYAKTGNKSEHNSWHAGEARYEKAFHDFCKRVYLSSENTK